VLAGDRDDEPEVGGDHVLPRTGADRLDPAQPLELCRLEGPAFSGRRFHGRQGGYPRLDLLGEVDLLARVEQRHATDLLQVLAYRIGSERR
jgi:hypothetical protein